MAQIISSESFFSPNEQPWKSSFSYCSRYIKHKSIFRFKSVVPFSSPIERFQVSKNGGYLTSPVCKKEENEFYMRKCVELAKKAIGCTSPNPLVGCVIVNDGAIVGQGFHPKAGQPHAEVFALREAGSLAENATAYVSLEPCNHYGRTPPCTDALITAKVKQVIVGMVDPNPMVALKGVERLKASGIEVVVGVEERLCQKLNEAYIHRMHTGRPFVILRYSLSFNGRILGHLGQGADGPGGYYSKLLQEYDAIVISADSLNRTSMQPLSHEVGAKQPLQIIIASSKSSLDLLNSIISSSSRVVVMAEKSKTVNLNSEIVETVYFEHMTLNSVLEYCGKRGLCSIMIDVRENDGSLIKLIEGSLNEGLVQKVVMELYPIWSARFEASLPSFGASPKKLKDLHFIVTNESTLVEGYL